MVAATKRPSAEAPRAHHDGDLLAAEKDLLAETAPHVAHGEVRTQLGMHRVADESHVAVGEQVVRGSARGGEHERSPQRSHLTVQVGSGPYRPDTVERGRRADIEVGDPGARPGAADESDVPGARGREVGDVATAAGE